MKILIYISSLTSGGAEKVASLMANYWSDKHQIILLTDSSLNDDFFKINGNVKRKSTNFKVSQKNLFGKFATHIFGLYTLRSIIRSEKPDIIISHMDIANVRVLLATMGLGIPVIVEDHNNPEMKGMPQPWKALKPITYRFANKIVLLTKELIRYYPPKTYAHSKIVIIPNPLDIPKKIPDSNEVVLHKPTFIALGSLTKQKGFDILLKTFAEVTKKLPKWHLVILGEGPKRKELEKLSKDLNINDKVSMPGRVKNPYGILKKADIYIMSSRFEGFPVALCEAMGVGLPCISFDCPTGPSDIIQHKKNGLLINYLDNKQLENSMIILAENNLLREKLSKEAIKINSTLQIDTIMAKWEQLLKRIK
ncbi:glycosyltransferase family 4 protein [Hydrogenimonas sp.]